MTLSFAALPSADYVLSDDVAVERKTAADFVASILDRRLFGQAARMNVLFPRAILIVEGDLAQVPLASAGAMWPGCSWCGWVLYACAAVCSLSRRQPGRPI